MKKIFLISFLFLLTGRLAYAAFVPCGPGTAKPECELCDFFVLINNLLVFAFEIIAFIAVVMAIVGGIFFFFAGTSPEALRRAKGIIISVVIGIAIILSAWVIVNTIFDQLGVIETEGWQWWNIQCTSPP